MSKLLTIDAAVAALAEELTTACGARLGEGATVAPTDAPAAIGWTLSIAVSGAADGRIGVWFDKPSASAIARVVSGGDVADDVVAGLLVSLVQDAARAAAARDGLNGLVVGAPAVGHGPAAPGARAFYLAVPNTASCLLAVGVERPVEKPGVDERLGAVLGVDLPLVVRFGRVAMPLRAVAELGPGSVIEMNRSPDEPVDLLVGDRLIARGEVVVVGGNYGVRITELAASKDVVTDWEARL